MNFILFFHSIFSRFAITCHEMNIRIFSFHSLHYEWNSENNVFYPMTLVDPQLTAKHIFFFLFFLLTFQSFYFSFCLPFILICIISFLTSSIQSYYNEFVLSHDRCRKTFHLFEYLRCWIFFFFVASSPFRLFFAGYLYDLALWPIHKQTKWKTNKALIVIIIISVCFFHFLSIFPFVLGAESLTKKKTKTKICFYFESLQRFHWTRNKKKI